jgi:hypothetical protein
VLVLAFPAFLLSVFAGRTGLRIRGGCLIFSIKLVHFKSINYGLCNLQWKDRLLSLEILLFLQDTEHVRLRRSSFSVASNLNTFSLLNPTLPKEPGCDLMLAQNWGEDLGSQILVSS